MRATGAAGTRDAYGARVRVTRADGTLVAPAALIDTATHFLGESERVAHVGLGAYDGAVDVAVSFSSGHVVTRTGVAADQTIVVTEPSEPMRPAAGPRPTGCAVRQPCAIDCDNNGVADRCEVDAPGADCNDNDVLDVCELSSGLAADCDGNGVLDVCDVAAGADGDGDGVPDVCAPDLGVVDVGMAGVDAGATAADAGRPTLDGGTPDGGAMPDAGAPSAAGGLRGGATCAVGAPREGGSVVSALVLLALLRRRRG